MRLMLHTFKKDVRRLWPAAVATWIMLAALANAERWRADWIPSPLEGWMNPLLTMAWAFLVALAVLEEPLVGDRNFWTTRPHSRPALLAAKLIFALLAIHVPSLLADIFVLGARGFSPGAHLGDLLWKQILFFGAVTLPSLGLAVLVRNFTHFVILIFVVAAGILMLNGGFQTFPDFARHLTAVRHGMVRILIATAAIAVIWTQYAWRRSIPASILAVAGAVASSLISAWLPVRAEYTFPGRGYREPPRISMSDAPSDEISRRGYWGQQPVVVLPIALASGMSTDFFRIPVVELEIVLPDGSPINSIRSLRSRPFDRIDLMAYADFAPGDSPRGWMVLNFSRPLWERVKNARVRIRGTAAFVFYRPGETTVMATSGIRDVPDVGRCTTASIDIRFSYPMLKVLCESPNDLPRTSVTIWHEASGRRWKQVLNSAFTPSPGPNIVWLSPLEVGQAFFQLAEEDTAAVDSRTPFPKSYVPSARLEITPEIPTGRALAHFDFGEVTLATWLFKR